MHERAKIIVEMEVQHPGWHTFRKYMHALEPADEDSAPAPDWEGITGRVKQLLELQDERVKQLLKLQDQRSENMLGAIESLDAKLVAIDRKITTRNM